MLQWLKPLVWSLGDTVLLGKSSLLVRISRPLNTSLYVSDFKGNSEKYISYLLEIYISASQNAAGAVPGVNRNHLHKIRILHALPNAQGKIAAVLSAYDDLIENNNRRIAILERMADELYREWFVRLRFPGHEHAKIVKGVPEGWKEKNVGSLITRIAVGKRYDNKTVFPDGNIPVLDQGQSGIIGYHNENAGVIASFNDPIITFANHTCYQQLVFFSFSTIQNVLPFRPNKILPSNIFWLHYATKDLVNTSEYKGHWPEFTKKRLYYPGYDITEKFGEAAQPIILNTAYLHNINKNLATSRDRLLSRLMSGAIDVENLDIEFPKSMQEEAIDA